MVKQASSAALLECVIWFVWNRRCRLTEVSESSTGQQGTLCVNLKKEGRGFILNNHVGIDEGGYYEGFSTPRHWPEAGEEGSREQGEIKNLRGGGRLDHFAGQHALGQGPLCPQFVIEWRVGLLFVGDG